MTSQNKIRLIGLAGIELIKFYESCRLKSYKDSVGIWTIGWGATYYQNGARVKPGQTITQVQADELLIFHATFFARDVVSLVMSNINQNQFNALVSFAFNVGSDIDMDMIAEGLGDSTLLKKVNANPNDPAIRTEFMKWNKAGGKVLKGLTNRRRAEANLYFTL